MVADAHPQDGALMGAVCSALQALSLRGEKSASFFLFLKPVFPWGFQRTSIYSLTIQIYIEFFVKG